MATAAFYAAHVLPRARMHWMVIEGGAGVVAARSGGATEIVDPRDLATGTMRDVYAKYDIGRVLPAMGYSDTQLHELEQMINAAAVDVVVIATPIDLASLITIDKPAVRVRYDLVEAEGSPTIDDVLKPILDPAAPKPAARAAAAAGA